jgi:hypothetical protein
MRNLHLYLNDHLAGSVVALELLDHLIESCQDSERKTFLTTLRADIEADQGVLENLLRQVDGEESLVRKTGAWLVEKLGRVKLQLSAEDNAPGWHQALEGLGLGILGKRALWRSLATVEGKVPELRGLDYELLEKRAEEQFERVQAKCLEYARLALTS